MSNRRGIVFTAVCALSLLVAGVVAIAWVKSFDIPWQLFGFLKDGEHYALRSKGGQFVLVGPPKEEVTDPIPTDIVWRMSNADFEWSEIGSDYVCGAVRRDTPTWQVYQRFLRRDQRGQGLEPAMRIWIAEAKDDPARFAPAHMLLMLAAEKKRTRPIVSRQKWIQTAFRMDADGWRIPEVIMRADVSRKGPDFAARWDLRQEWSDVMETPRGAVFHGWIWLGAMVLPLAWLARPRWRKKTWRRWAVNWVALGSLIIFVLASAIWARSWFVDEQFLFARREAPKMVGWREEIDSIASIASSQGQLRVMKQDVPHRQRGFGEPWGYQQQAAAWPARAQGGAVVGERSARFLAVELYELPSQVVMMPVTTIVPPGRVGPFPPAGPLAQLRYGVKAVAIRLWMIVAASAIVPALWGWGAVVWWKRINKEDRKSARRCLACGYDMRATPERCPECGEAPEKAHGRDARATVDQ